MTMPRSLSVNPETFAFGAGSLLKLLFLIGNRGWNSSFVGHRPDSERYAKNHANMTMPRSLSVNPKTFVFYNYLR